jgi:hypothetical protein
MKSDHSTIKINRDSREGLFQLRALAFTIRIVPLYYRSAFKLTITSVGRLNDEIMERTEVFLTNERQTISFLAD